MSSRTCNLFQLTHHVYSLTTETQATAIKSSQCLASLILTSPSSSVQCCVQVRSPSPPSLSLTAQYPSDRWLQGTAVEEGCQHSIVPLLTTFHRRSFISFLGVLKTPPTNARSVNPDPVRHITMLPWPTAGSPPCVCVRQSHEGRSLHNLRPVPASPWISKRSCN